MRPATYRLDSIERRVRRAILHVDARYRALGSSDAKWTRAIKNAVGRIGTQLGYQICAAGSRYKKNGEWLYDLSWVQLIRGDFVSLPLVLESEWRQDEERLYDFQKLVAARAAHRVMVFWASSSRAAEQQLQTFTRQIECFRETQAGDRYLFAWYTGSSNTQVIEFHLYVVKNGRRMAERQHVKKT